MDYSEITHQLYIGTTPRQIDYPILKEMGVDLVINMRFERPPHPDPSSPSIRLLWLPTFDSPLLPIPLSTLRRGVRAALDIFGNNGTVYTHCASGVHRGVAMGAAILISLGYQAEDAMRLIKERRPKADPYIWYIRRRIEGFARLWNRG